VGVYLEAFIRIQNRRSGGRPRPPPGAGAPPNGGAPPSPPGGGGAAPNYRITLLGYNYERLAEIADDLGRRLEQNSRVREVDTNATAGFVRDRATEFAVTIDRNALARHELSVQELTGMIRSGVLDSAATPGCVATQIARNGIRKRIRVRARVL
jgi:multidrug efflux pump subunit AcrB